MRRSIHCALSRHVASAQTSHVLCGCQFSTIVCQPIYRSCHPERSRRDPCTFSLSKDASGSSPRTAGFHRVAAKVALIRVWRTSAATHQGTLSPTADWKSVMRGPDERDNKSGFQGGVSKRFRHSDKKCPPDGQGTIFPGHAGAQSILVCALPHLIWQEALGGQAACLRRTTSL